MTWQRPSNSDHKSEMTTRLLVEHAMPPERFPAYVETTRVDEGVPFALLSPRNTHTFRVPLRLRVPVDFGSRPVKRQWESPTDKGWIPNLAAHPATIMHVVMLLISRASVSCTT